MIKRSALIVGGSVAGLGGVLAITPPHFGNSPIASLTSSTTAASTAATTTKAVAAATTATTTKKATTKTTAKATTKATSKSTTKASSGVSGTFSGSTIDTNYGPVQVQITVANGKITNAKALQFPNTDFRSQSINQQAIPYLIQETLAAQSANIQGVGGASYTSYGWQKSLASAIAKAGI